MCVDTILSMMTLRAVLGLHLLCSSLRLILMDPRRGAAAQNLVLRREKQMYANFKPHCCWYELSSELLPGPSETCTSIILFWNMIKLTTLFQLAELLLSTCSCSRRSLTKSMNLEIPSIAPNLPLKYQNPLKHDRIQFEHFYMRQYCVKRLIV